MCLSQFTNQPETKQSGVAIMGKDNKSLITRSILTLGAIFAVAYVPDSHAFGGFGRKVNEACEVVNGTRPFDDKGCGLCHESDKSKVVEPEWSAYLTIGPLAFCDQAPDSVISEPADNLTVNKGASVGFAGNGIGTAPDPEADLPLSYAWDFGGAAPNSNEQNPTVMLDTAGNFAVTLTATDAKGRSDPSPARVTVTVVDPNANRPPNGTIINPGSIATFPVGKSISFFGTGSDLDNNRPFQYKWDFGDGTVTEFLSESSRNHSYQSAGIYTATFTVKDSQGLSDPTPATRTITIKSVAACTDQDNDSFSPDGGACGPIDCNDFDAAINPGAIEACGDNVDNDCNGQIDNNDAHCSGADCVGDLLRQVEIAKASWDQSTRSLTVVGTWQTAGAVLTLTDALTGEVLATTSVSGQQANQQRLQSGGEHYLWEFGLTNLGIVPCRVRVETDGRSGERDVAFAPAQCSGKPPVTNNAPVANDDSANTKGAAAVTIPVLANDTDQDQDALTIVVFTQPRHGVVTRNGEALVYTPKNEGTDRDSFSYTVSDRHGGTDTATVSVGLEK